MNLSKKTIIGLVFILGLLSGVFLTSDLNTFKPEQVNAKVTELNYSRPAEALPVMQQVSQPVDFTNAAQKVLPAVVQVAVTKTIKVRTPSNNDLFDRFFGRDRNVPPRQQGGLGSGFFISSDGYILTNNHVVRDADEITIVLPDRRIFTDVKIIGADPLTDVALLKVSEKDLPYVTMGNSDDLKIGEWVLAIGSPFSPILSSTVTAGIVSGTGRNLNIIEDGQVIRDDGRTSSYSIENFIQTDAAINRGNSGGPLVNIKGEVVGINTAILSQTGNYEGYGFSIPIKIAEKVMNELKEYGEMRRGYLGVTITPVPSYETMKRLKLKVNCL